MQSRPLTAAREPRGYAAALISAATRRDVGRAFVDAGVMAAGARDGNLYLARNGALHLLAASGAPEDALVPYRVMPLSANTPNAEVFRTWMQIGPGDVILGLAPLFHITGLVAQMALSQAAAR